MTRVAVKVPTPQARIAQRDAAAGIAEAAMRQPADHREGARPIAPAPHTALRAGDGLARPAPIQAAGTAASPDGAEPPRSTRGMACAMCDAGLQDPVFAGWRARLAAWHAWWRTVSRPGRPTPP